jgi:hypothetical protein
MLFTRLTQADLLKLYGLIEALNDQVQTVRKQMKGDRARVARAERIFRDSLSSLMLSAPVVVSESDEEPEEEETQDTMARRINLPMSPRQ